MLFLDPVPVVAPSQVLEGGPDGVQPFELGNGDVDHLHELLTLLGHVCGSEQGPSRGIYLAEPGVEQAGCIVLYWLHQRPHPAAEKTSLLGNPASGLCKFSDTRN